MKSSHCINFEVLVVYNNSDILSGEEPIKITIMGKELIGPDSFHGFSSFVLSDLKDQLIHEVWMDLADLEGRFIPGKTHLKLQWIHSNITFYADLMEKVQAKINTESATRQELESSLEKLRSIFLSITSSP